jgi:hypothetical protein
VARAGSAPCHSLIVAILDRCGPPLNRIPSQGHGRRTPLLIPGVGVRIRAVDTLLAFANCADTHRPIRVSLSLRGRVRGLS